MDCKTKKRGVAVMVSALAVCLVAGGAFACTTGRAYSEPSDSDSQSGLVDSGGQNDSDTQSSSDTDSSASQSEYDKSLLLDGLHLIWKRNRS